MDNQKLVQVRDAVDDLKDLQGMIDVLATYTCTEDANVKTIKHAVSAIGIYVAMCLDELDGI